MPPAQPQSSKFWTESMTEAPAAAAPDARRIPLTRSAREEVTAWAQQEPHLWKEGGDTGICMRTTVLYHTRCITH